ncbi:hypothetical protein BT63DRAFT_304633 [Microthyrium microscopicum]|uniref:Cupin type-2 domain-containing protein n=1 Tax=Microthyrium microscopicum TaxID=703497 RepID=A0A6A6U6N6_9PEZI|nr:hypothetical protein BT63DRAFT_304633 [Microthyrium microscopicum]
MSLHITTHNAEGKAVFSNKLTERPAKRDIPIGDIRLIYSSHKFPIDLSTENDIGQYEHDRLQPMFSSTRRICPDNGTSICLMSLKPGAGVGGAPMHRTMTLDVLVVIEGEIEVHLDSGERRVVKTGDSLVQRATMHGWVNVTPNNGWARWVVFIQAAADAVHVGEKKLIDEWQY